MFPCLFFLHFFFMSFLDFPPHLHLICLLFLSYPPPASLLFSWRARSGRQTDLTVLVAWPCKSHSEPHQIWAQFWKECHFFGLFISPWSLTHDYNSDSKLGFWFFQFPLLLCWHLASSCSAPLQVTWTDWGLCCIQGLQVSRLFGLFAFSFFSFFCSGLLWLETLERQGMNS